jgi:hypothetical protein
MRKLGVALLLVALAGCATGRYREPERREPLERQVKPSPVVGVIASLLYVAGTIWGPKT